MVTTHAPSSSAPTRTNHLCWVYDDIVAMRRRAGTFLAEGAQVGERILYLGAGSLEHLRADIEATDGRLAALLDDGLLDLRSLDDIYGAGHRVEPEATVAAYAAATQAALRAGFTGLRVAAEATALVLSPAQREAFGTYEHLVDRYMVDNPFSALCAYDVRQLGKAAVEIACLHPDVNPGATPFRWYAADEGVGLAGQVDATSRDAFGATLARTMPLQAGPQVPVDARALEFIDHQALLALEEHALAAGAEVLLETDVPIIRRLAGLLELRAVRVV